MTDQTVTPADALIAELAREEYAGLTDEQALTRLCEPMSMGISSVGIPVIYRRYHALGLDDVSHADVVAARARMAERSA